MYLNCPLARDFEPHPIKPLIISSVLILSLLPLISQIEEITPHNAYHFLLPTRGAAFDGPLKETSRLLLRPRNWRYRLRRSAPYEAKPREISAFHGFRVRATYQDEDIRKSLFRVLVPSVCI